MHQRPGTLLGESPMHPLTLHPLGPGAPHMGLHETALGHHHFGYAISQKTAAVHGHLPSLFGNCCCTEAEKLLKVLEISFFWFRMGTRLVLSFVFTHQQNPSSSGCENLIPNSNWHRPVTSGLKANSFLLVLVAPTA